MSCSQVDTSDRAEVHLHFTERGVMRKVISWGDASVFVHDFGGICGMTMDEARELCIGQHVKLFGRDLRAMLR